MEVARMRWQWLFFGFEGRINRAKFWLATLIYALVDIVVKAAKSAASWLGAAHGFNHPVVIQTLCFGFELALWLSCLAVFAKRLHDRDKSGWWLLVLYIAPIAAVLLAGLIGTMNSDFGGFAARMCFLAVFAFFIWFFVELGCLQGTRGYNRYGRDPLAAA
jgi:uncharacterized membrane protein YhaH (DUF805 family)